MQRFDKQAYQKQYYLENIKNIKASHRAYYEKNKEKISAQRKKRYRENSKKENMQSREYYRKNSEKIIARMVKYNRENAENIKAYHKQYYLENIEKVNARQAAWKRKHPEYIKFMQYTVNHFPKESECLLCGSIENLQRHHPRYFNYDLEHAWIFCTLCIKCHAREDQCREKWIVTFGELNG